MWYSSLGTELTEQLSRDFQKKYNINVESTSALAVLQLSSEYTPNKIAN